jgi:regulator of protease activity HflC (stomatin/prohibitin superfamily)
MAFSQETFWSRYGRRMLLFVIVVGLSVLLLVTAIGSAATFVKNTDVAIIVNNVTGGVSRLENGGMVFHLPFGLSSVYSVDKSQRVMYLTREHRSKDHPAGEEVNIKTNDGSNVVVEVEVVYRVDPTHAEQAYRELGKEENIEEILRALTRSEIRSQFGELSTLEIAEASPRTKKINSTQQQLYEQLKPIGIEVETLTVKNFHFDAEYDRIIRDRKEADQILTNQGDYQAAATEEGKRMIAEADRDKQTALATLQGDLNKKLLIANGEAKRILTKAEQQLYQLEREGETAQKTAEQESDAVRAEGLRKAEAMEKLFAAYEKGGEGLVKEALVRLYEGVKVRARPYATSERIEQFQTIRGSQAAPATEQGAHP